MDRSKYQSQRMAGDYMKCIKKYSIKMCHINGAEIYITNPVFYDEIIADTELLTSLFISVQDVINCIRYISDVKSDDFNLFLAFAHFKNRKQLYSWLPVACCKYSDTFYPVKIRSSWLCRNCGHIYHGIVIMPVEEYDPVCYPAVDNLQPIPRIFKKIRCESCGKLLQNHLIMIHTARDLPEAQARLRPAEEKNNP